MIVHKPFHTGLLLLCLLAISPLFSNTNYYEFTPLARQAYEKTLSLRFDEARQLISKIKQNDPHNLVVYHVENYIDFFKLYLCEDQQAFQAFKDARNDRMTNLQSGDADSPYYLFAQADMRLHWALIHFRFGEYLTAFNQVSKAHKLLKKNIQLFPDFMPNHKDMGILHAMVGTVPDSYKWGLKLLSGLEGTIQQGRMEIEKVLAYAKSNDFIFEKETLALYAFVLLHLDNEETRAWEAVQSGDLKPDKNPLHCFVIANIAMRTGHNDQAIRILSNKPQGAQFFAFPYLDYMLGLAKLRRLDQDADQHLKLFLAQFKGRHFIKEAYQKLAWYELVHGNPKGYQQYIKNCLDKGLDEAGGDKNALKEAKQGILPEASLIQARLSFDGGYFKKAKSILLQQDMTDFCTHASQLEYVYRLGRILHGLKDYQAALSYYQRTINSGRYESYFFACNAALQAGLIYEQLGNLAQANTFYETCLEMNPDEYRTGLHQKAKAGLARIGK